MPYSPVTQPSGMASHKRVVRPVLKLWGQ